MIVPMKMLTLICLEKDREKTVDQLGTLGLMHIAHVNPPYGKQLEVAESELRQFSRMLDQLPDDKSGHQVLEDVEGSEPPEVRLKELVTLKNQLDPEAKTLRRKIEEQKPLGDFDPDQLTALIEKGVHVSLFKCSVKNPLALGDSEVVTELSRTRSFIYYSVISLALVHVKEAERLPIPKTQLSVLEERLKKNQEQDFEINQTLVQLATQREYLKGIKQDREIEVQRRAALGGMGRKEKVSYIRGYCPVDAIDDFNDAAKQSGWGILIEDPPESENVPTLLRRPKWVQPIKSVLDFIKINPGYDEVDISGMFLIFFSLFFAMIVGDAGYGVLFLVGSWAFKRKIPKEFFRLLNLMSISTIVWGLLTGNIFGIQTLPPVFRTFELSAISVFNQTNGSENLMWLCFLIGSIHITIAHAWRAWLFKGSPRALAQVGWICTTWVMFFTARTMVLLKPFPPVMFGILAVGVLLIVLFMTAPKKLKSEWFHHIMLPLDLIGNFVDVVSYVRLFAVGMATFAMASAFNQMGADMAAGGLGGKIAAVFVIGLGHTLNIMLAAMGVLVHGIRLNTLEFSGHLGLTWAGTPYTPFTTKLNQNT